MGMLAPRVMSRFEQDTGLGAFAGLILNRKLKKHKGTVPQYQAVSMVVHPWVSSRQT